MSGADCSSLEVVTQMPDDRSAQAKAYSRATQVMAICLEMVVPGLFGYVIDRRLGTRGWCAAAGFAAGFVIGLWQLLKLTGSQSISSDDGDEDESVPPPKR